MSAPGPADPTGTAATTKVSRDPAEKLTFVAVIGVLILVPALTFLFSFGNVWDLARSIGVPKYVAPLVAPAVDLSVTGLFVAVSYLALRGVGKEKLKAAYRLLHLSGLMTLALNCTGALSKMDIGKAAFDAVGPTLLIGWGAVGPILLRQVILARLLPIIRPLPDNVAGHGDLAPSKYSDVTAVGREVAPTPAVDLRKPAKPAVASAPKRPELPAATETGEPKPETSLVSIGPGSPRRQSEDSRRDQAMAVFGRLHSEGKDLSRPGLCDEIAVQIGASKSAVEKWKKQFKQALLDQTADAGMSEASG